MNTSQTALRTIPVIALTIAFCTAHAQTAPARKATPAQPAPAAKADRIMSIDELRVCMKLQQTNEKNAGEILDAQDSFKRDQDAVRAEQAEVRKASDARRTRLAELTTERDAIATAVNDLNTRIQAAQKEADKTALEPERVVAVWLIMAVVGQRLAQLEVAALRPGGAAIVGVHGQRHIVSPRADVLDQVIHEGARCRRQVWYAQVRRRIRASIRWWCAKPRVIPRGCHR